MPYDDKASSSGQTKAKAKNILIFQAERQAADNH
jgi:hypothetical protein